MKLGYAIIYVADVANTIMFYENAFNLKCKFIHENEYGELLTGDTTLAFASEALRDKNGVATLNNRPGQVPAGMEIGFIVEDVEAAFTKAVLAGALPYKLPEQKPWGQKVAYIKDCNGFLVELCNQVAS